MTATTATLAAPRRLPPRTGEWIDRERPIRFRFEGREYSGFLGDTLSSALAAHGVRVLGRSFKYHRPRGIYSLANHDVNAMVSAGLQTNIRADVTPIWEGADFSAVNTWGGVEDDRIKMMDHLGRFLPVGFYYKTFHKPRRLFPFWERQMRAMAGLGAVSAAAPRRRTPKRYDWCDVLVVGGGPAGLSAAIAASKANARVILADEPPRPGGSLLYQWAGDTRGHALLPDLLGQAAAAPNLEVRSGTVAAGYYADHWIPLVDPERMTKVRAGSVVLATGAAEQPALFRNNDLPGVMLASAAQRLLSQYSVKPFDRAVVFAANADGYRAALDLLSAGIDVEALVDWRPEGEASALGQRVTQAGISVLAGHVVYEALAADGDQGLRAAVICPLAADGSPRVDAAQTVACDGLLMSVGWAPSDALLCQARGKMAYDRELEQFIPQKLPAGVFAAGRLNGVYPLEDQCEDGRRAGLAAAAHVSRGQAPAPATTERQAIPSPTHPYPVIEHPAGKVFIDLDEDVQLKDIKHAAQEGFDSIELLKRYSTFGMGPSQGKIANTNTIRVLAKILGQTPAEIGAPTSRPFYHPVPLATLAGRGFHPYRQTPLDGRHRAAGAQWIPAGDWRRPAYYAGNPTLRESAIVSEVLAVRERVGLIDVGTLGKLEVNGPDAAEFLERVYTGRFAGLAVGGTRYGLMCDESGVIIDDGVIGRLAEDRFYVTTTTTASGSVYREMQRLAIVWRMRVVLANLTGSTAAMNLAGPLARGLLAELCDLDLSEKSFPYLGLRQTKVLGVDARLLRTGFVGEVGYEIHVPAHAAAAIWDGLLRAGQQRDIKPFGVEAQRVLRLEKGHVIVSQDTDGLTHPLEAGMAWALKMDKPFFIGQRSLKILKQKPLKRQLIGFTLPEGYSGPLPKECHLVIERGEIAGRVTSISHSPSLKRVVGLAYVVPEQAQVGRTFQIRADRGQMVEATVAKLPFYDPHQARQRL